MSEVREATEQAAPVHSEADNESAGQSAAGSEALVESDLLVEDVSIDGMCGVY